MIELDADGSAIGEAGFNTAAEANAVTPGAAEAISTNLGALVASAAIKRGGIIDQYTSATANVPATAGFDRANVRRVKINVGFKATKEIVRDYILASEHKTKE